MDMFQNQNYPYQDPYYQNYKYFCNVCRFGAPYIEMMQYHYAFQCKRYFFPVVSQQQPTSSQPEFQAHQKQLQLQPYSYSSYPQDTRCYSYYNGTKNTYPSPSYSQQGSYFTTMGSQSQSAYTFHSQPQAQTAFAVSLPEVPATPNYFYSYKNPELPVPFHIISSSSAATCTSTLSTVTATFIKTERVEAETSSWPPEVEDPLPGPFLSEWVCAAVTSLSFSNIDFPCPFSRDFAWDADHIEIQPFEPPLPSIGQVDSVESQFYAFEQGLTDTYDDLGNNQNTLIF